MIGDNLTQLNLTDYIKQEQTNLKLKVDVTLIYNLHYINTYC